MEHEKEVELLREHMNALRSEVATNSASQRTLARLTVGGLALVFALRKDVTVAQLIELLPLAPIIGLFVFAFWVAETQQVFRLGRWLEVDEHNINVLAGRRLLAHEEALGRWRTAHFRRPRWALVAAMGLGSLVYSTLVAYLTRASTLHSSRQFLITVAFLAVIAWVVAAAFLLRLWAEVNDATLAKEVADARLPPHPDRGSRVPAGQIPGE